MDGRFYLVHFTTTDTEILTRFGTVWHLQSPEGWTVSSQNDRDTFTAAGLRAEIRRCLTDVV